MSSLEVSVAAGDFGPVIVPAGEADLSSIAQLNEVLTAQVSVRTSHLTIDVANLRSRRPGHGTGTDPGRADRQGPGRKRGAA